MEVASPLINPPLTCRVISIRVARVVDAGPTAPPFHLHRSAFLQDKPNRVCTSELNLPWWKSCSVERRESGMARLPRELLFGLRTIHVFMSTISRTTPSRVFPPAQHPRDGEASPLRDRPATRAIAA